MKIQRLYSKLSNWIYKTAFKWSIRFYSKRLRWYFQHFPDTIGMEALLLRFILE